MENNPTLLFEIRPAGYEPISRKDCHGKNVDVKYGILNLQKRMEQRGWVNSRGAILLDEMNMVRGVIQQPKSEQYHFCIITSNAPEEHFNKVLDEFKKLQKYCDIK
jgi:hypothetical protein